MTNSSYIFAYLLLGAIILVQLIVSQIHRKKSPASKYYRLISLSLLFWIGCNLTIYVTPHRQIALFASELKFVGVAVAPVFLFLFTTRLTRASRVVDKSVPLLFFLVPLLTVVLALTNDYHFLFRQSIAVVSDNPRQIATQNGLWFAVHTAYSYILMVVSVSLAIWAFNKTPREQRMPLYVLVIATVAAAITNALTIFLIKDMPMDGSLITNAIMLPFMYWAMSTSSQNDYMSQVREELFSGIDNPIFVLDTSRKISEMNHAAAELCNALRISRVKDLVCEAYLLNLLGNHCNVSSEGAWNNSQDVSLQIQGHEVVYSISERDFCDSKGTHIGTFVTLTDITKIHRLIDKLEREAGMDPLTGLLNRNEYERALAQMDTPDNLPISVILGDVNNLKQVNDTYGHDEGDQMLKNIGNVLSRSAPAGTFVARIGGDEFVMLLCKTPKTQALSVMDRIRAASVRQKGKPYRLSIALGCATKTDPDENLYQLVERADREMYLDKRGEGRAKDDYAIH